MNPLHNICPAQCEKSFPFRNGPLLPENQFLLLVRLLFARSSLLISVRMARFLSIRLGVMTISVPIR